MARTISVCAGIGLDGQRTQEVIAMRLSKNHPIQDVSLHHRSENDVFAMGCKLARALLYAFVTVQLHCLAYWEPRPSRFNAPSRWPHE